MMGGARSIDITDGLFDKEDPLLKEKILDLKRQGKNYYRIRGINWFLEEMPSEEELERQIEAIFSGIREKEDLEDCKTLLPSLSNLLGELCESDNCKEINLKEPLYTIREMEQYYCRNFSYIQQKCARKARLGYSRTVLDMIDYIEKNYPQELSLELLGEKFHMNGVYLGQIFKKETGQTFLKYLTNVRISEAKRLLREENSTVAETAQMVGYRTSQYFSQIFMRNVGMKPQEYKKQREE